MKKGQSHIVFLSKFFQRPRTIGAVAPSSRHLARQIVGLAGVSDSSRILEFGPGTGSFTREILRQKREEAKVLAVEMDSRLVVHLRKQFPDAVIAAGSAANACRIMEANGFGAADCIVSGLPWAAFDDELQESILNEAREVLKEDGVFTTFAYASMLFLPAAKRFRGRLERAFGSVEVSPVVWRNLPPAVVYRCTK
ncbi:16S ribosomal RNA methyltransferase KsgA/Dim1 family protein [Anaerohalosphaera lusitana]|uniref:16S ribosomal RNA methyltransferase KsgA/Dim1 family protein n=1 Tax=Anaerohalosphaera lusitana TaxID=1936003 RepID=A0A1U9NQT5_9BACT|nr:methyltransferase domain-containing protein [Anaerohalosphaera lusitana]AQT69876.1 16S ribosomal RNA methyltransferase KsgA/Dim1 family protein [Anaerohalosphaera lusitana]